MCIRDRGYCADKEVRWVNGRMEDEISMTGRLIGGCLDVIVFLLGTSYDGTEEFIKKYNSDGIIWKLESFQIIPSELYLFINSSVPS